MNVLTLRAVVRGAYDLQKLRIQDGNRLAANYRARIGIQPTDSEEEAENFAKQCLLDLRASYERITDGIVGMPPEKKFKADGIISDYADLCLVHGYMGLLAQEQQAFKNLEKLLPKFPIYEQFLKGVKGCGPAMSAVIVSELDPHKAAYPSSFWKYCGLDVAADGRGRGKFKEHLTKWEYKTKAGTMAFRDGITFNPFLKTKLLGVLSGSFLKCGNHIYAPMYSEYKARLEHQYEHATWRRVFVKEGHSCSLPELINEIWQNKESGVITYVAPLDKKGWKELKLPPGAIQYSIEATEETDAMTAFHFMNRETELVRYVFGKAKIHRHRMALRYIIKRFLVDLHMKWRELEGLEVTTEYSLGKLGMVHKKAA